MPSSTSTARLDAVIQAAAGMSIDPSEVEAHVSRFDSDYLDQVQPRSVVRHLLMLQRPPRVGQVASRVTPVSDGAQRRRELDVVTIDTPGLLSRICGVVSLGRGQVVQADAHTTSDNVAVDTVEVEAPEGVTTSWWARFEGDLVDATEGRIALRTRVDMQAREAGGPADRRVEVEVVEGEAGHEVRVRTADRLGLLFAITDALAELRLDIRSARITTRGGVAEDRFLVRTAAGAGLDAEHARQAELGVAWAVARLGSGPDPLAPGA